MVYYQDGQILIRDLCHADAQIITDGEIEQGWHATVDKYLTRLEHQQEGKAVCLAAEYCGNVAGYINVYPDVKTGPFGGQGLPEIVDFGVLAKYRNRGIGSKLMDMAEKIAAGYADRAFLAVGLHSGYGSAQRMYVKRGYIPDGSGVWYRGEPCPEYAPCANDDDLTLFMSKKLR